MHWPYFGIFLVTLMVYCTGTNALHIFIQKGYSIISDPLRLNELCLWCIHAREPFRAFPISHS